VFAVSIAKQLAANSHRWVGGENDDHANRGDDAVLVGLSVGLACMASAETLDGPTRPKSSAMTARRLL
jgi:hypothetical protein